MKTTEPNQALQPTTMLVTDPAAQALRQARSRLSFNVRQKKSMTTFTQLNRNWNAEPNAPNPQVQVWERDVVLSFLLNPFQFPEYSDEDVGLIRFKNCSRYRVGSVNDEGWYRGQCRFSGLAPKWGEFYEVSGDLRIDRCPSDWIDVSPSGQDFKHFLFYFRDEEFECDAESWTLTVLK